MKRCYDLEISEGMGLMRILYDADYRKKNPDMIDFLLVDYLYVDSEGHIWDAYETDESGEE